MVDPGTGEPARLYAPLDPVGRADPAGHLRGRHGRGPRHRTGRRHRTIRPAARPRSQAFGDEYAAGREALPLADPPTVWCSWYHYFEQVTAADIAENLRGDRRARPPVDVVQIDDGWSPGLGEGLAPSPEFGSLPALVDAIRASGRRAGLWLAPFLVGTRTTLARRAPRLAGGSGRPQLGPGPRRPRPHPPRRAGPAARRARSVGRPGRGLPQARLPLRRCGARPAARRRGRGGGLPRRAGAGPGGGRTGRVPRRLRRAAAPERGAGGRDAGLARHLPRGRRGRLRRAARADAAGGPGVDAGPALGQRPRLRGRAAVVPAARAVGRARPAASAGCRPSPTGSPTWTTGAWPPSGALLAEGGSGAPLSPDRVREGAELAQAEGSA